MTAPDPGLTDLIAAAITAQLRVTPYGDPQQLAEAVVPVVEQHTNGRIAELEEKYGHLVGRNEHLAHWLRVRIGDAREARASAEKAEATIGRVRDALTIGPLHRLDFPKYRDPYAIDRHVVRAALEGEQQ